MVFGIGVELDGFPYFGVSWRFRKIYRNLSVTVVNLFDFQSYLHEFSKFANTFDSSHDFSYFVENKFGPLFKHNPMTNSFSANQ